MLFESMRILFDECDVPAFIVFRYLTRETRFVRDSNRFSTSTNTAGRFLFFLTTVRGFVPRSRALWGLAIPHYAHRIASPERASPGHDSEGDSEQTVHLQFPPFSMHQEIGAYSAFLCGIGFVSSVL